MPDDFIFPTYGKGKTAEPPSELIPLSTAKEDTDFVYPTYAKGKQNQYQVEEARKKAIKDGILPQGIAMLLRGATFGLSDKALSAGKSLIQKGGLSDYEKNLSTEQDQRDAYAAGKPGASMVGEALGGLTTGALALNALKSGVKAIAPSLAEYAAGKGAIPATVRTLGNLAFGGGAGAVGGAGQSKSGEELKGAAQGAAFGAGTSAAMSAAGGVANKVAKMSSPIIQRIMLAAGVSDPNDVASKRMVSAMLEDGQTPDSIAAKLKELGTVRGSISDIGPTQPLTKPVIMADVMGPNSKALLKSAITKEGSGAETAENTLLTRSLEQPDRVASDIRSAVSPKTGFLTEGKRISDDMEAKSAPLYDAAKAVGTVDDPKVMDWFKANKVRQGLFNEIASAKDAIGKPLQAKMNVKPDGELYWEQYPSISDLHEIKMQLDAKRSNLWDADENKFKGWATIGGHKYDAKDIGEQRNSLVKLIEDLTPDGNGGSLYGQARKVYADSSDVQQALRDGFAVMKERPESVKMEFEKLSSDAEREAYRAGVASSLYDVTQGNGTNTTMLRKIYGSPQIRDKLDTIMSDDDSRELFSRAMNAEQEMTNTNKQFMPKTQSLDMMSGAGSDFALPLAIANAASGRLPSALAQLSRYGAGQLSNLSGKVAEPVVGLGMMSPDEAAAWAKIVAPPTGPLEALKSKLAAAANGVSAAAPYVGANIAGQSTQGNNDLNKLLQESGE